MLSTETKQRINTARDVLVGKVPDPKSQVEQITIAMIYKFMDDMDKEAIEFGGEPTFFAGEFDKYAWSKLFDPRLGGAEMLTLYAEAIVRMNHNPNIPQLFRDIFKNAFLPYRDPETLKLFLKTINGFAYDHSEDLGDAFEYLLQVMGSQGDAGQFRTPRHIIDFMVAVVQPQKHETIADPACGTAGFLVSAYNYIRNQNTDIQRGDLLTPSDRQNIVKNVKGYDISPDMVRLSLVNLYLHGFTNPQVLEYDTLTSEDRWNEYFDVILANPPFMSPKGGIKPHRRFSIQSSRSEVLFLDYIAEHLRPGGRAAVIVPEGVIFQSGTAYKSLRKLLVDKYLWAVVSLPAGVFQPYSGVKTSILLLDRTLTPKIGSVLFVKVKADGYDLGAQRRTVVQNDLPNATNLLNAYRKHVMAGGSVSATGEFVVNDDMGLVVEKERIVGTGEYYLSGERYKRIVSHSTDYDLVRLGDICEFEYGKPLKEENRIHGQFPVYGSNGVVGCHNEYLVEGPFIVIGRKGSAGAVHYSVKSGYPIDTAFFVKLKNENRVTLAYLYNILQSLDLKNINVQAGVPGLNRNDAYKLEIPLPLLSIQQQIVAEIEGYQRIIDGARQVVEAYKPQIQIDPAWEMVALGDACKIQRGRFSHRPRNAPEFYGGSFPFIQTGDVVRANGGRVTYTQTLNKLGLSVSKLFDSTIVLITIAANIGDTAILDYPACFPDSVVGLVPNDTVDVYFLELMMRTKKEMLNDLAPQAAQKNINNEILKDVQIPLPPLKTQQRIVANIEREQALVNANKELIQLFGQKIKDRVAAVWGRANTPGVNFAETVVRAMPYAPMDGELAMVAEEQV